MSRLTYSPFHKPSPFEFPKSLPSPPETHSDTLATGLPPAPTTVGVQEYFQQDTPPIVPSPDTVTPRMRKTSSLAYHHGTAASSSREARERPAQRLPKSLIIVIPPANLISELVQHGASSIQGPHHRISQGVVMPLHPSLFSQLTAVAREFNFPSTSGICLYFHHVEDGVTLTPRITDESWQTIWNHLTEPPLPNERRPLIGGKVEFDVDARQARWLVSWSAAVRREADIAHRSTAAPSFSHVRGESRTTVADSRPVEDEPPESSILQQRPQHLGRHVPKKLSLVERHEPSIAARSDSRLSSQLVASPPDDLGSSHVQILTTIMQEDEPKTAKQDLESRVRTWRASSVVDRTPLATAGQTSLDPVNLPNNMSFDLPTPPQEEEEELNLEDFTWSVSSAGPKSCQLSPVSWSVASSVGIAHRMVASACSSPSYRTSFGPSEYDPVSPMSSSYACSVDLGGRMQGSVCSTPSIHTSFGPSDYDPFSPVLSAGHLPTPDVACFFLDSSPPTPGTATTWGPPLSYPPSPRCASPTASLDLGERFMYDAATAPRRHYPRVDISGEAVSATQDVIQGLSMSDKEAAIASSVIDTWQGKPWGHAWPYNETNRTEEKPSQAWPDNWEKTSSAWSKAKALLLQQKQTCMTSGCSPREYPYLIIYPPIYPNFDLYPAVSGTIEVWDDSKWTAPIQYPNFDLYPCVYPHNLQYIYARSVQIAPSPSPSTRLSATYPSFDLYPAVYPFNLQCIYPSLSVYVEEESEGYPYFNIYPATSPPFFNHLSIYIITPRSQYPHFEIYPETTTGAGSLEQLPSSFSYGYPHFDIYPAVKSQVKPVEGVPSTPKRRFEYPVFDLYPAVYPFFDLYPAPYHPEDVSPKLTTSVGQGYPSFNIYPSVYPYLDIYPTAYMSGTEKTDDDPWKLAPSSAYPDFCLYPMHGYPYFNIYPALDVATPSIRVENTTSACRYPSFNLYPAVYPHFDLYPAITPPALPQSLLRPRKARHTHAELHAMVVFPSNSPKQIVQRKDSLSHAELHAMVMMERRSPTELSEYSLRQPIGSLRSPPTSANGLVSPISPASAGLSRKSSTLKQGGLVQGLESTLIRKASAQSIRSFYAPTNIEQGSVASLTRKLSTRREGEHDQNLASTLTRKVSQRDSQRASLLGTPPRRRDSLVLQRAKALDTGNETAAFRETLSKFPMPQRGFPPLPPLPADR